MRAALSSAKKPHPSGNEGRVERFVTRYVDSPAKAELLRVLAYRPNEFQALPEILALTASSAVDIERAIFALREFGLVQLKEGPKGTAVALAPDSIARRLAPALWAFLKKSSAWLPHIGAPEASLGRASTKRGGGQ